MTDNNILWQDLSQVDFAMSADISEIAKAMAECRSQMVHTVKANRKGQYNNDYADLDVFYAAGQKKLADHGLTLIQPPTNNKISNLLMHTSGQWIYSAYSLPPHKADPQGDGAAITYGLRYNYGPIVGLSLGDDGDGEAAMPTSSAKSSNNSNQRSNNSNSRFNDPPAIDLPGLLGRIRDCQNLQELGDLTSEVDGYIAEKRLYGRGIDTCQKALRAAEDRFGMTV